MFGGSYWTLPDIWIWWMIKTEKVVGCLKKYSWFASLLALRIFDFKSDVGLGVITINTQATYVCVMIIKTHKTLPIAALTMTNKLVPWTNHFIWLQWEMVIKKSGIIQL